ncbi:MAG: flavin reductase family protein [Rhizobiales bacterium]|nr:flavin reductase family protein [Hyphomicrobiales bacterium]
MNLLQPAELRRFAGLFTTGVGVVTTTAGARSFGTTVNSVTSLSLAPPLYLVCLNNDSATLTAIRESRAFALHFLGATQREISQVFAKKGDNKFDVIRFRPGFKKVPVIEGVLAFAECELLQEYPGGDHTILIGRIESTQVHGGEPLIFHGGRYVSLGHEPQHA